MPSGSLSVRVVLFAACVAMLAAPPAKAEAQAHAHARVQRLHPERMLRRSSVVVARRSRSGRALSVREARGLILGVRVPPERLPPELPAMTVPPERSIAPVVARVLRESSNPAAAFVRLEDLAATLRGSAKNAERQRAGVLRRYLSVYKAGWAERFVTEAFTRYRGDAGGVGWHLLDRVRHEDTSEEARPVIESRLREAWDIARGLIAPEVLARVPSTAVQVTERFPVAGIVVEPGSPEKILSVRPDSTVRDILHELGHLVEDYGGARVLATSHALRAQRSTGVRLPLTTLLPGTRYAPHQRAFAGSYVTPYMGRDYGKQGFTEVLSIALEHFHSPKDALALFHADGDLFLKVLGVLQPEHP